MTPTTPASQNNRRLFSLVGILVSCLLPVFATGPASAQTLIFSRPESVFRHTVQAPAPVWFQTYTQSHLDAGPNNMLVRPMLLKSSGMSCERENWDDKRRHFILSMALTTSTYLMLNKGFGLKKGTALALSVSGAIAVGYGKELWDTKNGSPPCFSKYDLLANMAGIAAATGIIVIF